MARQLRNSELASVRKQLIAKQGGVCCVCGKPFTKVDGPCVDHCHTTGYIRGVLHRSCNQAEGRVRTKANLGHKGISATDYLIGLGKFLNDPPALKFNLIHPTHMTEDQKRLQRNAKAKAARARKKAK